MKGNYCKASCLLSKTDKNGYKLLTKTEVGLFKSKIEKNIKKYSKWKILPRAFSDNSLSKIYSKENSFLKITKDIIQNTRLAE